MQKESNSYTMYGFPYHSDYCDPVPLLGKLTQVHLYDLYSYEILCCNH